MRVTVFALILALAPAGAARAQPPVRTPAETDARKAGAEFPVFERDGSVVASVRAPVLGLGRVKVVPRSGAAKWLPESDVDLPRSQAAWAEVLPWALLDRSPLQGRVLPGGSAGGPPADVEIAAPSEGRPLLVVLWKPPCLPCQTMAEDVLAVHAGAEWREDVDVVAACLHGRNIDDAGNCWLGAPESGAEVRHAEVWPRDARGVYRALGGSSCLTFLVDGQGRVVRSDIRPAILDQVVAAEVRARGPSPKRGTPQPALLERGPEPPEVALPEPAPESVAATR